MEIGLIKKGWGTERHQIQIMKYLVPPEIFISNFWYIYLLEI